MPPRRRPAQAGSPRRPSRARSRVRPAAAAEATTTRQRSLLWLAKRGFVVARSLPLPARSALRPLAEIAARLVALRLVFMWGATSEDVIASAEIRRTLRQKPLAHALSPADGAVLRHPRAADQATIGWRLENMLPLAWILGHEDAPRCDGKMIGTKQIGALIAFIRWSDGVAALRARARPRPLDQIAALEDLFYAAHNAVRSAQLGGKTVPAGFNPVANGGVIHERRHALTWALSPGISWAETDLST